jgi:hypothetical protein
MRSPSADRTASAQPLVEVVPPAAGSVGPDMVELAAGYDLILDPWQQDVLVRGGWGTSGRQARRP